MRTPVDRIGVSLPFVEVIEPVAVRILFQHVGVGNRQAALLDPFVRYRRMHFGGLQGCGLSVGADEMFFGNEEPGTPAEGSLRWLATFLQNILCIFSFAGRRREPLS